jgi:putative transposase
MDDRSRVICHAQWYLDETTETLVHGVAQALQKAGITSVHHE